MKTVESNEKNSRNVELQHSERHVQSAKPSSSTLSWTISFEKSSRWTIAILGPGRTCSLSPSVSAKRPRRTGVAFRGFDEAGEGDLESNTVANAAQAVSAILDEPYPAYRFQAEIYGRQKIGQARVARSRDQYEDPVAIAKKNTEARAAKEKIREKQIADLNTRIFNMESKMKDQKAELKIAKTTSKKDKKLAREECKKNALLILRYNQYLAWVYFCLVVRYSFRYNL